VIGDDVVALLGDRLPAGRVPQAQAEQLIGALAAAGPRVIDLGCGEGASVDHFRGFDPGVRWLGVDVAASPEVARRERTDAEFAVFDGVHIPAADGSVDAVYCKQVLEHVREPAPLLADVCRALRPGGLLGGSTSQLEPFHSYSTWNYTPHGLSLLLADAGLELLELRPGIDALALIVNRGVGMRAFTRRWFGIESPLNRAIAGFGRARRLSPLQVNAIKLLFCGQFTFLARRPG
jgi:SAM-dependent methyltransferase